MAAGAHRAVTVPGSPVPGRWHHDDMGEWHPIVEVQEREPGVWVMADPLKKPYGLIELRRVNDGELRYKVTFRGELLGWAGSLKYAAERMHGHYLRSLSPQGAPNQRP